MARKRSGINLRLVVILSAVFLAVGLGYIFFSGNLIDEVNVGGFLSEEQRISFGLFPNNAVNCAFSGESIEKFTDGSTYTFGSKSTFFNPNVVTASLVSSLVDKPISTVLFKPFVVCDLVYTQDAVNLVGGTYKITITATDSDSSTKTVISQTRTLPTKIPLTSGVRLGTQFALPVTEVTAKNIQDVLPNAKLLPEYNSFVKVTVQFLPEFTTALTGTGVRQTADVTITSQFVAKVISPVQLPTVSQGTIVRFASTDPILPIVYDKASTTNTQASLSFKAELDKWTSAEGFPYIDIFAPNGALIHSKVGLSFVSGTSGDITTLKRSSYSIGDRDSLPLGQYKVVLHSANDVRKNSAGVPITATMFFNVVDTRTGVTQPPVTSTCPSLTTLQSSFSKLTTSDLQANLQALNIKSQEGSLSTCETQLIDALKTEITKRGEVPIVTAPQCIPPQISVSGACVTPTPSTQCTSPQVLVNGVCRTPDSTEVLGTVPKAFINYKSDFTSISTETNRDCIDTGKVPKEGLDLTAFQLFSVGGVKCDTHRWAKTELRPVIDFGESAKDIIINSADVKTNHQLFISLNNPFPDQPEFTCTKGSATEVRTCTIKNFDTTKLLPTTSLSASQVAKLGTFSDPAKINTEFGLSLVSITEQQIVDRIINSGVTSTSVVGTQGTVLKEGDIISYLIQVDGVFKGTQNGQPISGAIGTLTYSQNFAYNAGAVKCSTTQYLDIETQSCKDIPKKTCQSPLVYDSITNSCVTGGGSGAGAQQQLVCSEDPICTASQNKILTGDTDVCGFAVLTCQEAITGNIDPTSNICTINCPLTVQPNANGGCPAGYTKNSLQLCQRIGSLNPNSDPKGSTCEDPTREDCKKPLFQLTGTTLLGVIVFVVVIIILIIIAVVVRRRRGGGGIIG